MTKHLYIFLSALLFSTTTLAAKGPWDICIDNKYSEFTDANKGKRQWGIFGTESPNFKSAANTFSEAECKKLGYEPAKENDEPEEVSTGKLTPKNNFDAPTSCSKTMMEIEDAVDSVKEKMAKPQEADLLISKVNGQLNCLMAEAKNLDSSNGTSVNEEYIKMLQKKLDRLADKNNKKLFEPAAEPSK